MGRGLKGLITMGGKGKNKIPEGWVGCPTMSTGFIDDRFFVFKTPLRQELNGKVPKADRFSMDKIFEQLRQMNNARIGLWIDLTNTSRYYEASDVTRRGIMYEKFACEGHGRPPSPQLIYDFCGLVHRFFRNNQQDYIGVHCTHGFNRTGFLICCYLIRFRRYTAEEAVFEFAKYRQPGIYRQIYVDELYLMTRPLKRPPRVAEPSWLNPDNIVQIPSTITSASTGNTGAQHQEPSHSTRPNHSRSIANNSHNWRINNTQTSNPGSPSVCLPMNPPNSFI